MKSLWSILLICLLTLVQNVVFSQELAVSRKRIREVVLDWNEAHMKRNVDELARLYDSKVLFYGVNKNRTKCLAVKRELFEDNPNFSQRIVSPEFFLTGHENGIIRCRFTIEVILASGTKQYVAYLLLDINHNYRIVGESDLITDKNLNFILSLGSTLKLRDTDVAENIVAENAVVNAETSGNFWYWPGAVLVIVFGSVVYVYRTKRTVPSKTHEKPGHTYLAHLTQQSVQSVEAKALVHDVENIQPEYNFNTNSNKAMFPVSVPELKPEEKGHLFEKFIAEKFVHPKYFQGINWRQFKRAKGQFFRDDLYPDLEYDYASSTHNVRLAVECKWRKRLRSDFVTDDQLSCYRAYQAEQKRQVYLALGVGGEPANPDQLFLVPLEAVITPEVLTSAFLKQFKYPVDAKFWFNQYRNELSLQ